MKRLIILSTLLVNILVFSQVQREIPILKYDQLEEKIHQEKDQFLVVNFWSTTCAPCVKELPEFMEINALYENREDFKMLLVSLDRSKDLDRVHRFLEDKNINAEVVLLDDIKRMNTWIPRYDADWGGEIPVTIFYHKGEKGNFIMEN